MKKGLYAILAVLTVFAMVMVSCDDGSKDADELYTVSFDANGGAGTVAAIKQASVGEAITLPAGTALTAPSGKTFGGWSTTKTGTALPGTTYTPTKNITLFAVWSAGGGPGPQPGETFDLGKDFTASNGDTQKGWCTDGVDNTGTDLTAEDMVRATQLVLKLAQAPSGGLQFIWQGDGNNWGWAQQDGILNNDGTATDIGTLSADGKTLTIDLKKAIKGYDEFIVSTKIKFFLGYYSPNIEALGIEEAYLVLGPPPSPPGPSLDTKDAEKVSIANSWYAIYSFKLPAGKTWGDYKGLSADYMFTAEDLAVAFTRNGRIMGPYADDDFTFYEGSGNAEGKKLAVANYNGGKNAEYILDGGALGNTGSGTLQAALAEKGITAEGGKWFTYDLYDITGGRKNGSYITANLPTAGATGTFYFGLGLPSSGGSDPANVYYIRDVTLVGYEAADNVIATPLYFSKDGANWPVFAGYNTTDGSNGFGSASRKAVGVSNSVIPFNPNLEKVSLANSWYAVYKFELPAGKTWADYKGMSAEYMFTAADLAVAFTRNGRIMGPYQESDFTFYEGTEAGTASGKKMLVANYNGGKNAEYILDGGALGNTGSGTLQAALAEKGITAEGDKWFTYDLYDITGGRKNGSYIAANYPADTATGPFYFGLGLPSSGGSDPANVYTIRNVTLVGYEAADSVIATPAYLTDAASKYNCPVFAGYNTTDGSNGFGSASRSPIK